MMKTMSRATLCILSTAIAFVAAVPAAAQKTKSSGAAEQALIQTNEALAAALRTGDTAALQGMLAADLVFADASGAAQSKAQLLAAVANGLRIQIGEMRNVAARIDGNVGLVDYQSGGDAGGSRTSAVYVMRAGRWQLASQSTTGSTVRPATVTGGGMPIVTSGRIIPAIPRPTPIPTTQNGNTMNERANGTFEVDVKPLVPYNAAPDAQLGRMSIDKRFHGDLEGVSKGEMLTAGNPSLGAAGYVAVERVTGTLRGRHGSFSLQHTGTMGGGSESLSVTVVPGSGTGELKGISGTMKIIVAGSKHSYEFDYAIRN